MENKVDMKEITLGVVEARYFAAKGDGEASAKILNGVAELVNSLKDSEAVKAYAEGFVADFKDYGFEV
ncbi:hypothetical protein [uncultured Selenomonas sp.]|uniref:hypothetical protein n=1 Tax=uncultured Selenomonas sp. TaxID=159275 RepID=UPI002674AAEB|nr:hypothetical protein [uncultured Selenomonas sp.]